MAEKPGKRMVQVEYQYDRLATQKLALVYKLLVFDNIHFYDEVFTPILEHGDSLNENRSDLRPCVFGQAKGRKNN